MTTPNNKSTSNLPDLPGELSDGNEDIKDFVQYVESADLEEITSQQITVLSQ